MAVRPEILELQSLGPLPTENEADGAELEKYEAILARLDAQDAFSREELSLLVEIFGSDECYGLAWSLLHLIERNADEFEFAHLKSQLDLLNADDSWHALVKQRWSRA